MDSGTYIGSAASLDVGSGRQSVLERLAQLLVAADISVSFSPEYIGQITSVLCLHFEVVQSRI